MTATVFAATVFVWSIASEPMPKQDEKPTPLQIAGIEKGTLKLTLKKGELFQYSAVMTDDGPRVRLVTDSITLEATRLDLIYDDKHMALTAVTHAGGKPAIDLTFKIIPVPAPMPKAK